MTAAAGQVGAGAATVSGERRASAADWTAVMAGIVGAFMAALDISVTNASLPQIQGEIGATGTEGTWIATGYLVAEIVMIPLTAWLTRVFGLRRFLIGCASLFTLFSLVCGTAGSLSTMILGRVGQGFFGGALIPTAMTIVATRLPPSQQPAGLGLFGVTVILAPVGGPLLGGWITDGIGWHWLFFMNLPIGVGLLALLTLGLRAEPSNLRLLRGADWIGVAGLVLLLGSGTVVLEEGQRERWFESAEIVQLTAVALLGALLVGVSQVTRADPVLRLRLFRRASFAGAVTVSLIMGAAFYTVLYLVPVFLSTVAGYSAEQTGVVNMYSGAMGMLLMPLTPLILKKVDARIAIAAGLLAFAVSCWLDHALTSDYGRDQFFWSQLWRGVGQTLMFFPLSQAALVGIAEDDAADASGLFNMARNLGGSIGLALTSVLVDQRQAFHASAITQSLTANDPGGAERVAALAGGFAARSGDDAFAHAQALRLLGAGIQRQALVMTYADCFWIFGVAMLAAIPAVLLLRKPGAGAPAMVH